MNANDTTFSSWLGPLCDVATGLSHRCGYASDRALVIATEVQQFHARLHQPFKTWWEYAEMPDHPEILGYSPRNLIEQGRCRSVPVAFTWLDALIKNPQEALERIRASYDIIGSDTDNRIDVQDAKLSDS